MASLLPDLANDDCKKFIESSLPLLFPAMYMCAAPLLQVAPDFRHPPGVTPKTSRRQLPRQTQGWTTQVLVNGIHKCTGKQKYVCCNFAPLPANWHDLESADLAAKVINRFPDCRIGVQTPGVLQINPARFVQ